MKIAIGCDHAGFPLKQEIAALLRKDHEVLDVGAFSAEPSDYPDCAEAVGRAVIDGAAERGVLVCGSGVGASSAPISMPPPRRYGAAMRRRWSMISCGTGMAWAGPRGTAGGATGGSGESGPGWIRTSDQRIMSPLL